MKEELYHILIVEATSEDALKRFPLVGEQELDDPEDYGGGSFKLSVDLLGNELTQEQIDFLEKSGWVVQYDVI